MVWVKVSPFESGFNIKDAYAVFGLVLDFLETGAVSFGRGGGVFRAVIVGRTVDKLSDVSIVSVEMGRSSGVPFSKAVGLSSDNEFLLAAIAPGEAGGVGWFKDVMGRCLGLPVALFGGCSTFASADVDGLRCISRSFEITARSTLVTAPERRCA